MQCIVIIPELSTVYFLIEIPANRSELERDGMKDVAFALHANYGSNVLLYPAWHQYFRRHQPRTLVMWGKGDYIFTVAGAEAYKNDLPKAEIHILDTGHFALETHAPLIAWHIVEFFGRN